MYNSEFLKVFISKLLILCLILPAHSQKTSDTSYFVRDSLDIYLSKAMMKWKIPGMAICIVKNGKIICEKGFGMKSINQQEKVDENTLFMIGSNTKAFTATALAMLEYENRCKLTESVVTWVPDFKMQDSWVSNKLTLTDILCHRIGMETFQGDFMYWTSDLSTNEAIKKFGLLTPKYSFRSKWGYTNLGFVIAGECIKRISNLTWDDYIEKKLLKPLKMTNTIPLSINLLKQVNVAQPHTLVNDSLITIPIPNIDNIGAAGSISSSASDMRHWLVCQLNNGVYDNQQLIPSSVIKKTRDPQSIIGRSIHNFNKTHYKLYALGWELMDYEGYEIIFHTGAVNGYLSSVTLIPEENLGIVVLTNSDQNYLFEALKWEIVDSYLNLPYRQYSDLYLDYWHRESAENESFLKTCRDTIAQNPIPVLELTSFTGYYTNKAYGYIKVDQDGKTLKMKFEHHPDLTGKLEYIGNNNFLCTYSDPTFGIKVIPFRTDKKKVIDFTLKVADFLEFTDYNFVKN